MMQLNMLALTAPSKRFLKPLMQRGCGHIVNIASLAVCPGPVATAFKDRSGAADSWLYRLPKNTPEKIARTVCRAIKSHRSVVLPGIFSKFLAFAGEMPPRRIALEVNNLLLRSSR
jgi:short-subunit dehydrogenase